MLLEYWRDFSRAFMNNSHNNLVLSHKIEQKFQIGIYEHLETSSDPLFSTVLYQKFCWESEKHLASFYIYLCQ